MAGVRGGLAERVPIYLETDDERDLAYRVGATLVREVYASGRRVAGRPDA